ncbi:MAG: hypothetical protein JWM47_2428 [Acidimicrobiales bacterium]|nr:hypothetical protein [Acidimicrobiales bacterium]
MSSQGEVETAGTTIPDLPDARHERRYRIIRSIALAGILLFVMGGLAGAYGVKTAHVSGGDRDRLHAELTYPGRARPALAVPYELRITRTGGFDGPIEVATTTRYLQMFDENGRSPEPKEVTTDRERTIWSFDPPPGDTLVVWLDTRVEPGVQWRRKATTTVTTGEDQVVLRYTTWIFP